MAPPAEETGAFLYVGESSLLVSVYGVYLSWGLVAQWAFYLEVLLLTLFFRVLLFLLARILACRKILLVPPAVFLRLQIIALHETTIVGRKRSAPTMGSDDFFSPETTS